MSHIPKISVILSVFNGQKYIRESVQSVLSQDFRDFEFLIVNDASSDETRQILDSFHDERIRVIHNSVNLGLTRSLNLALSQARAEYVARQDADDLSMPNRFSEQIDFLDRHPKVGFTGSHVAMIDDHGKKFSHWTMPTVDSAVRNEIAGGGCFCHGAVMFRTRLVRDIGGYREVFRYAQDLDLWLRLSEFCQMANIGQVLYCMRRSRTSITRTKLDQQLDFHLLAVCLWKQRLNGQPDELSGNSDFDLQTILREHYQPDEIHHFKAKIFILYYHESLRMKNRKDALIYFWGGLRHQPAFWKIPGFRVTD